MAKILPGEYYVTNSPQEVIITTLGSCISACVRDPAAGLGGMNHFMLPGTSGQSSTVLSSANSANCYGVFAMENLINEIVKRGGERTRLEIKITGGARIGRGAGNVGESNAKFILKFLALEGFHAAAIDLGGTHPRKVQYEPLSGKLRIKKLLPLRAPEVIEQERQYLEHIASSPISGTVELF